MSVKNSKRRARTNLAVCLSLLFVGTVIGFSVLVLNLDNFLDNDSRAISASSENAGEEEDEDDGVLNRLVAIIQLDESWGKANDFQRTRAKLDPGLEPIFTDWLDRDRSKAERVGNHIVFTGNNITVTAYAPPR
jgi:hypothetical protein